jgi:hypothetical protein
MGGYGPYDTISDSITGTSYSFTGKDSALYAYRVRAKNNLGDWCLWSTASSFVVNAATSVPSHAPTQLSDIRIYPNPYKIGDPPGGVTFDQLTGSETIRIYTISGELVRKEEVAALSWSWTWDVNNNAGVRCARGVYIYMITDPSGVKRTGKIAIID